jgi:dihydrofolate reductase
MRRLIAAINMTLDGFCDHTAGIADEELHQHYNELLSHSGAIIYGRITYQLMESYWPTVVINPTGNKPIFKNINHTVILKLIKTKTFGSGAIVLYYKPIIRDTFQ